MGIAGESIGLNHYKLNCDWKAVGGLKQQEHRSCRTKFIPVEPTSNSNQRFCSICRTKSGTHSGQGTQWGTDLHDADYQIRSCSDCETQFACAKATSWITPPPTVEWFSDPSDQKNWRQLLETAIQPHMTWNTGEHSWSLTEQSPYREWIIPTLHIGRGINS